VNLDGDDVVAVNEVGGGDCERTFSGRISDASVGVISVRKRPGVYADVPRIIAVMAVKIDHRAVVEDSVNLKLRDLVRVAVEPKVCPEVVCGGAERQWCILGPRQAGVFDVQQRPAGWPR